MNKYKVVIRRANGRFVKETRPVISKYKAKQTAKKLEEKYDETYHVDVVVE